jgi:tetratricopeptide (TPR) repeat protein
MAQDLIRYVEDVGWPAPMRRTVYMNLLERMVQSGDVQQTEGLYNEAMGWASQNQDRGMQAWLLFAGSRLDQRRQDLYRARDRANDALKMYKALGDKFKEGEVRTHLASIELADGNFNAALDQARLAEEVAPVPPMQAHAEFVRGMVARRDKTKLSQAIEHFRRANEIAGNAGNAPLALEAGLAFGEALFVSGQPSKSADVLAQVARIAQSLRNPARERAAASLLAQSHAALNNFEAAIQAGRRTLELTQSLKFEKVEAVDLYNLGFFHLRAGKPTEAVSLFKQARGKADATEQGFQRELLFNHGLALHAIGERGQALDTLGKAADLATQAKDWRKVMVAHQHMGELQEKGGNLPAARNHLQSALRAADAGDLKEDRKALRRKLDQLGG